MTIALHHISASWFPCYPHSCWLFIWDSLFVGNIPVITTTVHYWPSIGLICSHDIPIVFATIGGCSCDSHRDSPSKGLKKPLFIINCWLFPWLIENSCQSWHFSMLLFPCFFFKFPCWLFLSKESNSSNDISRDPNIEIDPGTSNFHMHRGNCASLMWGGWEGITSRQACGIRIYVHIHILYILYIIYYIYNI